MKSNNCEVRGPLTMGGETVNVAAPATVRYLLAGNETAARLEGDVVAV